MFDSWVDWVLIGFAAFTVIFVDLIAIVFYILYKRHEQARIDWEEEQNKTGSSPER